MLPKFSEVWSKQGGLKQPLGLMTIEVTSVGHVGGALGTTHLCLIRIHFLLNQLLYVFHGRQI